MARGRGALPKTTFNVQTKHLVGKLHMGLALIRHGK